MKNTVISSSPNRIRVESDRKEDIFDLDVETSTILIVIFCVLAALTGIWGIACLISGMQSCDSMVDLGTSWVIALSGTGF